MKIEGDLSQSLAVQSVGEARVIENKDQRLTVRTRKRQDSSAIPVALAAHTKGCGPSTTLGISARLKRRASAAIRAQVSGLSAGKLVSVEN